MSQVRFTQRDNETHHDKREARSSQRAVRQSSEGSPGGHQKVQVAAVRGLLSREAAQRRNRRLLAELQVTEARLRSLARYGPATAILQAERARFNTPAVTSNPT